MKKRIVNIRPLFVVWLSTMLGILTFYCATNVVNLNKSKLWFALLLLVDVAVVVLFVLSFVKNEKLNAIARHKWLYLTAIVSMLLPMLVFGLKYNSYKKYPYISGETNIVGRVDSCNISNENATIVLTDCKVGEDNRSVGRITLYITDQIYSVEVGSVLSVTATIRTTKLFTDENNIAQYSKGKVYTAYCASGSFYVISNGTKTITEKVRDSVNDALHDNLNKDNADVAYAMLFGDKSAMSYEVYEAFSYAGVSHMLAVSGLHIGFLVAFMTLILSFFRTSDKLILIIVSAVLVFYCVLCDFTASVTRASIMAVVLLVGQMLGKQHDNLSSLSLAGALILLVNPMNLLDYGYQLSFMCVITMITLNGYVTNLLMKIKIPRAIATSFAVSLSVNISLIPLTSILFGSISIIGIFSNIILVPIFSVAFPLLFYGSLIVALLRFLGFVLFVPNVLLHIVRMLCIFVTKTFAPLDVFYLDFSVVVLMIASLLCLKFLMLKVKTKTILLLSLVGLMVLISVFGFLPKEYNSNMLVTWGQYDSNCAVVTTTSGKKILFDYDDYRTEKYLRKHRINKIDSWVLPTFTLTNIDNTIDIIKRYDVKNLYIYDYEQYNDYSLSKLTKLCKVGYVGDSITRGDGFDVQMFATDSRVYGVMVRVSKTILFDMGMTDGQMSSIANKLPSNINYCLTKSAKYDTDNDIDFIRDVVCTIDADKKDVKSIADNSSFVLQL